MSNSVTPKTHVYWCILYFMLKLNRQLISRLLILTLSISLLQPGYAGNHDGTVIDSFCQTANMQSSVANDTENNASCSLEQSIHCPGMTGCTASASGNLMQSRHAFNDPLRTLIRPQLELTSTSLFTIYADLRKRPPIA